MNTKEGFIGGFMVLSFAVFIVGFLTGMLAIALMSVRPDYAALLSIVLVLGLITGMLTTALLLVIIKLTTQTRKSTQDTGTQCS